MQAAYRLTDAQVLDMTMLRLRQAAATIAEARFYADVDRRRLATLQLRTLCTFIAMTVPTPKGRQNPMIEQAQQIHLGDGTDTVYGRGPAADAPPAAGGGPVGGPLRPGMRLRLSELPDGPDIVRAGVARAGQPGPAVPAADTLPSYEQLLTKFGGL